MPKKLDWIVSGWALLAGVLTLLIVLATTINTAAFGADKIARLFGANVAGLAGYEDFVRLTISAVALMFFPYCQRRKGHVAVDLFADHFSVQIQQILEKIILVLTILLALFLAYWMSLGMISAYQDFASSPILGWPNWPFYIPGILSLVLWALVAAMQLREKRTSE
ncbi:TRAP transporter small permease [Sneathiella sp. CAU 1612]|jgi:TRAP-type C4-dicarboxylate transport system permease small subunit|uniref:TRAP transporter small permease protein n=1 Tax=Sneathiella sedimenti TaxID=2816034 RepID=A0ABS3F3R5_9PROT|nr:TRAP transporter small permease [Sneathiella sedimenti]MBO0333002.1 TRAP transporter small permease [Sneathiella sedimenti]